MLTLLLFALSAAVFGFLGYGANALPDRYAAGSGTNHGRGAYTVQTAADACAAVGASAEEHAGELLFLRVFPVKSVAVAESDRKYVTVGGELVGIRLRAGGVTVVGTQAFETETGTADPAKEAGVEIGDIILTLDGTPVTSNKTLTALIEASGGAPLTAELERNGTRFTCTLRPQKTAATGAYKCGLWVRDSAAGIGTLTFSDAETGRIATLGHAICDTDTGQITQVQNGAVYTASVVSVTKGETGKAGEIEGRIGDNMLGSVDKNCPSGVYGALTLIENAADVYPVATPDEVHTGAAQILCTVAEGEKRAYDIEIDRIYSNLDRDKNMTVTVTDTALLAVTGGIVQGMSGSPILQDGRFVGAVTHVFVNDPRSGYAIFADKMLEAAAPAS